MIIRNIADIRVIRDIRGIGGEVEFGVFWGCWSGGEGVGRCGANR